MNDLISRQQAIDAINEHSVLLEYHVPHTFHELKNAIKQLPSAQPYSEADIQKIQDLEQAEIQKAYELGKLDAIEEMLSVQPEPCEDAVSRQKAIDEITEYGSGDTIYMSVVELKRRIEHLPPAQPEIIRCKDCKYCEHWYADKGRCFLWHEGGIDVFEDGFCNYAERRTDE